jgi:ABC-type transport system involved in cytochrome c biogenesis permease component
MTALPLIQRELRVESRRVWNYWSRLAAGALATVVFALATVPVRGALVSGLNLFNQASIAVVCLIWLIAPLLTADCLSRERREGTLGLLFLTPLTPGGIVVAKGLVHALRGATLLLAAVPVLSLSMLFGGVSLGLVLTLLMHCVGALCVALAAGILASAWTRDWLRSVLLTVCFTVLFAWIYYRAMSMVMLTGSMRRAVLLFAGSILLLVCAIVLAAERLRQSWQEGPPSKWFLWWFRTFCSPMFWKELFRRASRKSLERNPIGWLHERTATARSSKWLWCCGAVFVSALAVSSEHILGFRSFELAIILAMAFAGSSSFRSERQNGVLELLLVAPLRLEQIIGGRLRALTKQFAPAVVILVVLLFGFLLWAGIDVPGLPEAVLPHCFLLLTSLGTLPVLGLYTSFRVRRFLTAWLIASLIGLAAPYYFARLLLSGEDSALYALVAILQLILALAAIKVMRGGLTRSALALQMP